MKQLILLLLTGFLAACASLGAPESQAAELGFSSFDGGGPEYHVEIEDAGILTYSSRRQYDSPDHERMTGSSYKVIFTFTGLAPGSTKLTVRYASPITESGESHYTAIVDENLNVTLERELSMKLTINDIPFDATLADNDTARAFAELLPMTLDMEELNRNEKYHYLLDGLPAAPEAVGRVEQGDIMLFGDRCVVIFYKSFNTSYSYTPIGKITATDLLETALGEGDVQVSFEP